MLIRTGLLLLAAMLPAQGLAQTARQSDIRSRWDAPDAPRMRDERLMRAEMMRAHNDARAAAKVAPLIWDESLAADATGYARELARARQFRHSSKASRPGPQGENLWMGTQGAFDYAEMAASWVDERRYYRPRAFPDVSTTGQWADVGHYTQIVWSTTTRVGCGVASNGREEYLVCRYSPPGNVFGRFAGG